MYIDLLGHQRALNAQAAQDYFRAIDEAARADAQDQQVYENNRSFGRAVGLDQLKATGDYFNRQQQADDRSYVRAVDVRNFNAGRTDADRKAALDQSYFDWQKTQPTREAQAQNEASYKLALQKANQGVFDPRLHPELTPQQAAELSDINASMRASQDRAAGELTSQFQRTNPRVPAITDPARASGMVDDYFNATGDYPDDTTPAGQADFVATLRGMRPLNTGNRTLVKYTSGPVGLAINDYFNQGARVTDDAAITDAEKAYEAGHVRRAAAFDTFRTGQQDKPLFQQVVPDVDTLSFTPRYQQYFVPPPVTNTAVRAVSQGPAVGEIRRGYRYIGGNPSSPESWQRIQ